MMTSPPVAVSSSPFPSPSDITHLPERASERAARMAWHVIVALRDNLVTAGRAMGGPIGGSQTAGRAQIRLLTPPRSHVASCRGSSQRPGALFNPSRRPDSWNSRRNLVSLWQENTRRPFEKSVFSAPSSRSTVGARRWSGNQFYRFKPIQVDHFIDSDILRLRSRRSDSRRHSKPGRIIRRRPWFDLCCSLPTVES